jgi:hypothetical protein
VWGSGDISQKALWDDYTAAYLSHKDSVEMLFITDTGASGLSRFSGTPNAHAFVSFVQPHTIPFHLGGEPER